MRAVRLMRVWLTLCLVTASNAAWCNPVLLWEVSGGSAPVWLFGSVHLCSEDCFPLPVVVEKRFAGAELLAVELDPARPEIGAAIARMSAAGGHLRPRLSDAEWERLRIQLALYRMSDAALDGIGPTTATILISLAVAQRAGLSPSLGIDQHFVGQARQAGKPLIELETVERQIQALSAGTPEQWLEGLRSALRAAEDGSLRATLDELVAAWKAGDVVRLADALRNAEAADPTAKAVLEELFDRRNREMSAAIATLASGERSAFVVVGSGHLAGPDSIPQQLRKRGFAVRQMTQADLD